jgi:hypothetical protein
MKLKDAPVGSRILFSPGPNDYWCQGYGINNSSGVVIGTIVTINNKEGYPKGPVITIGFRHNEKHAGMQMKPTSRELVIDPLIASVNFFVANVEVSPALNRRFLC